MITRKRGQIWQCRNQNLRITILSDSVVARVDGIVYIARCEAMTESVTYSNSVWQRTGSGGCHRTWKDGLWRHPSLPERDFITLLYEAPC
jgi:hypothetical protein